MTATVKNQQVLKVEVLDRNGKVTRSIACTGIKAAKKQQRKSLHLAISIGGDARIVDEQGTVL